MLKNLRQYWANGNPPKIVAGKIFTIAIFSLRNGCNIAVSESVRNKSVRGSKFPKSTISSFSPCDIIYIYIVAVSIRDIAYYNPFVTSWTSPSLSVKFCQYTSLYKLWDARNMQTRLAQPVNHSLSVCFAA